MQGVAAKNVGAGDEDGSSSSHLSDQSSSLDAESSGYCSDSDSGGDLHHAFPTLVLDTPTAPTPTPCLGEGDGVRLIDYEYSGFNPVAFDIANHWCEWAADYHGPSPHILDFDRLPSAAQQQRFVEDYLSAVLCCAGISVLERQQSIASGVAGDALQPNASAPYDNPNGTMKEHALNLCTASSPSLAQMRSLWHWLQQYDPNWHSLSKRRCLDHASSHAMLDALLAAARAYICASHFKWALWGFIQAKVSDVDFNFIAYAQQRWQQYLLTRPHQLN